MSPRRCLASTPPAALSSLLTALLLLVGGAGPPLARALPFPSASPADALGDADAEMDSDATQRVLGSSVVTSVSVIMDLGNGTKVLTEPGPMPRPGERIPAVASPASLMHPDRYEFYTFDEAGDLVKRYMTLPQIQSMIAGGDGSPAGGGLALQPLGEGRVPAADAVDAPAAPPAPPGVVVADHQGAPTALGVREVVDRVQNVLRSELEANKNKVPTPGASPPTAPLAEEPGDASGAWSVLLPAMMGSAVETASPSTPAATSPTPVATNATTERAAAATTPAPTAPQHDEDAPQPTTFKSVPSETPSTEASPSKPDVTEVPTTIKPAESSTLKHVPTQGSTPEIVTEASLSTSSSSNLSGSSESDESPQSSEDVSLSTSGSLASESEESQEGSTESNAAPPDTQSPQDDAALSKPPQTPSATAQAPASPPLAQPETTVKTTAAPPKTTPYPISSETPMLLTVVEPSPETPMLIPVFEPSPPTLLDDDMNRPILLPQKPLFRPIVVPEERVPITTEEPDFPQQSADQSQDNPAEVLKPSSSDGIVPPVTEQSEVQTTLRPFTVEEKTTPPSEQGPSSSPTSEEPDQEAQSQKIPPLFLGLLPPFPDPLEDGPSMPDEIPLLLDPVPMLSTDTATDPPITTYRPPFTTTVSSTARPTAQQETTEPEVPTQTVRPTRAPEVSETTEKITTIPADIGLKTSAASDSTEKEPSQPETQPPRAEPTATTEQPTKAKEPEKPEETDDTDTAESDSSQLKGVAGTTLPPVTEERPLPETPSSTESKETTFAETTFAPSALPRTPSTPSTPRQPETEHPAELDISEELADSLSSVLSQVAEQPTTILIDPSTSDAILKVDDQKEDQPEPVYIATPQVTEQPKAPTTTAPNEKTPEQSTEADSATSAGTAVKDTLPANGGTHDTSTNVPADTTPSADKAQPNPEVHTTIPTVGQPSLVTLNVADVTELRQQTTTTTELSDDRENKVTPRPVTVALVELAPVFKNPSSIQPPQLFRIASSTTTTTTAPEEEPSATDETMHLLGSGEEEEFINNKEIEKDIEKETEDEKENDALVKRQEEAETQANQEATTEAKSPEITTIPQKTEETFVATTTPKASTPFKIVVQDSPVIYEDEDTFNSYTATPQSSSPSPFTATPSAPSTEPPSIPDATNPPATPPAAQQTTVPEATPDATATTLKAKDEPVLITTPAIKLLPPESLNMGSDKEGTDMVNNSQEDEDVHSHKDSKPLSKIVPEDFPVFVPAATAIPEVYKVRPTTIPPTQAATEVPATTLPPTKAQDQDPSPEGATEAYNTRYEESSITDTAPGTETPAPETPAAHVATTEKEVATTLVEESETTKTEDDTTKNEETTVSNEEGTPQATDAPTTLNDDQPIQETTQPAEESTDAEEVAESTAYPILKKEAAPEATTLQDEIAEAADTTVNPVKEDATTQPRQETEAPATETLTPEETDKPVETEKPTLYNAATEAESPAETEKPIVNETPAQTEAPAVTEQVADETPLVTEKPTETEKPSEEETPAVTEKSAATEVPAITDKAAETAKPEEMEKPTETEKPTVTENQAETEKPTETQKPEEEDDSVMMEPATGTTTAAITSSDKPAVEEKLESSSSSPVLTKIGDLASPEVPEDPVVVLITKPPVINNFGVKDSAHDIRPTSRPRPPPAVHFQPLASTLAPLTRPPPPHQPAVQVTPAPQLRPTQFEQDSPVSLAPAPGENLGLEATTVALGGDVRKFADLCNELAFRLWGAVTVRGLHSGRSVVMSPMGVTSTLAMVFLGARGPTSGQMNDILKLDDMVTFNPHQVFRNVTESVVLGRHPGIATAAFVRELYSDRSKGRLLDFYKERAQQFYDGHVEEVNFSVISDLVRRRTNMLVKRQTRGRVPEYLRGSHIQLHPPLAAFGANIFQTDCSAASTEGRDGEMYFTVLPGSRQRRLVLVPAAVWRSDFLAGYDPHLDCTAAAIGGAESLVSVVLLLPGQQGQLAPGDGVAALERRLTEPAYRRGAWARVLRSLLPRPGLELQLPRFSHRSLLNVTAALQRMGLRDLFSAEKADLRGLNGVANDLHLSDIVQVNTFSTCAEGTTGGRHHAEVYPSGGGGGSGGGRAGRGDLSGVPLALRPRQGREPEPAPAPAPRLRFDRPFIYAVRHNPTGFILHMGRFNPHLLH